MIELVGRKQNLVVDPPVLPAPGIWVPDSRVPLDRFGVLVSPPLGWTWDGDAVPFAQRPAGLVWMPPQHSIERFFRRIRHRNLSLPLVATLASDEPAAMADAADLAEVEGAQAVLLWNAPTPSHVAAVATATLLPVIAEYPAGTEVSTPEHIAALMIGPPTTSLNGRPARLWGPAVMPLLCDALRALEDTDVPTLAGGCLGDDPADVELLRAAGADAVCIGPERWVRPITSSVGSEG